MPASTRFAYAGSQLIQESDVTGAIARRYVPGPGVDEPVVWYEGAGTADRRWLHADERGSVIAISDGTGAMLAINRYDEYGIPRLANAGRFQYTGQAWLPELGMYHYKARTYSPTLGRFMQTDPIGYGDGMNWYNYVGSDPVNASDPSGLLTDDYGNIFTWNCAGVGGYANTCGYGYAGRNIGGGRQMNIDGRRQDQGERRERADTEKPQKVCSAVSPGKIGSTSENWNAATQPFNALTAKRLAAEATSAAQARFPNYAQHNDAADAYRHFYWNFSMTRAFGASGAASFANSHEVSVPNPAGELAMDLHNNAMGRAMGADRRFRDLNAPEAAELAFQRGCLRTKD